MPRFHDLLRDDRKQRSLRPKAIAVHRGITYAWISFILQQSGNESCRKNLLEALKRGFEVDLKIKQTNNHQKERHHNRFGDHVYIPVTISRSTAVARSTAAVQPTSGWLGMTTNRRMMLTFRSQYSETLQMPDRQQVALSHARPIQ